MKFGKYTTGTTIELLVLLGTTLNVWLIIFLKPNEKPKEKDTPPKVRYDLQWS